MEARKDSNTIAATNKKLFGNYNASRRKARTNASQYREGPIPVEELDRHGGLNNTLNQLDSDLEDNLESEKHIKACDSLPGSRGLLMYFARLSKASDNEVVDFYFVETLIHAGANVNFTDRHGQSILHTIARDWHPDVAKFVIERGADVNLADKFGRTPLHVAAVYDHSKMVEFLIEKGGLVNGKTFGEDQTVVHYAAKKNSLNSLKVLLKLGGAINARDYKGRTPLFIAAELGRTETVKYLLEYGAPAGVYDTSGTSALAVMVEKMPDNAKLALDQFLMVDGALRKTYYYLNYLEQDVKKQKVIHKQNSKSPLELIVLYKELDLIMNPVIQKLMNVKWNHFGFKYTMLMLLINLSYTLIWTALGFTLPREGGFYDNLKKSSWKIVLECVIIILTLYFIAKQLIAMKNLQRNYRMWKDWKIRDIERDLNYCHPRYPDERRFLMNEIHRLRNFKGGYFQNFWNIFEWLCLISIIALMATRGAYTYLLNNNKDHKSLPKLLDAHKIIFALTLLFVWLRLMRVFRGFKFLAAFITLLSHVATETIKFAFLFIEFFVPFVCAFWMLFGGKDNAAKIVAAGDNGNQLSTIPQTAMTVWTLTLIGDIPYQGMVAINEHLAQIFIALYWALVSLVCVNLYIALMSETFSRVYANAQANANLEQASLLLTFEGGLNHRERKRLVRYFNRHCNPLEEFSIEVGKGGKDADAMYNMLELILKQVDRMEMKITETNVDIQDTNEEAQESIADVQEDISYLKNSFRMLSQQQTEILDHLKTSGIKRMVNSGGDALETIKSSFGRLLSRRNSVDAAQSVTTTETSFSDGADDAEHSQTSPEPQRRRRRSNATRRRSVTLRQRLKRTSSEPVDLDRIN